MKVIEVVQFLNKIQETPHSVNNNNNQRDYAGRFESISNFQKKKEILLPNFSSAKEGKQSEKVLASLPSPRSISFPSKYANLRFDTIVTVFVRSPQNG